MLKKITNENLAVMMKKGFDGVAKQFQGVDQQFGATKSLIKLTPMEMATAEEQTKIKSTVDSIWKMLDDEARFIQQMRTEYPLLVKRLERIEKKLGLPHRILE